MSKQALTCHQVVEIITDYLEDVLSLEDRHRVEEHLAICEGCTTYVVPDRARRAEKFCEARHFGVVFSQGNG